MPTKTKPVIVSTIGYCHDNFDIQNPFLQWSYTFDEHTFELCAVDKIGIALNSAEGSITINIIDAGSKKIEVSYVYVQWETARCIPRRS